MPPMIYTTAFLCIVATYLEGHFMDYKQITYEHGEKQCNIFKIRCLGPFSDYLSLIFFCEIFVEWYISLSISPTSSLTLSFRWYLVVHSHLHLQHYNCKPYIITMYFCIFLLKIFLLYPSTYKDLTRWSAFCCWSDQ